LIDLEKTILPWFGKTNHMLSALLKDTFRQYEIDLSREQWILLHRLQLSDGQAQNDLAIITNRDKTSLTRLINNMENKKLVYRDKDQHDKRINRVYRTNKGQEIYLKTLPIVNDMALKIQEGITTADLNALIEIAKKVQNNIENQLVH
jgi:DNA-binding MarR family transcriptional regulator